MKNTLLVIIPTINERENIQRIMPAIHSVASDCSILIVDDQSSDGTPEAVNAYREAGNLANLVRRQENPGYGKSILAGLDWGVKQGHEVIMTMDADFSHDPSYIPLLLEALEKRDAVFGSRYCNGGGIARWSYTRRILSKLANWYVRAILRMPTQDCTTGFCLYRAKVAQELVSANLKSEGYAFLVESKYLIGRKNYKCFDVPIIFTERREGQSKMSFRIIWESIWRPWKLLFNNLFNNS